jgi:hypothetical protein
MVQVQVNVTHVLLVKITLASLWVVQVVNIIQELVKHALKIWVVAEVQVLNEVNLA